MLMANQAPVVPHLLWIARKTRVRRRTSKRWRKRFTDSWRLQLRPKSSATLTRHSPKPRKPQLKRRRCFVVKIRQLREQNNSLDQVNIDLTFYVFYNLANMYHANGLHQEALNSYTIILKNKQYPQASRLRVNMGNIYFEQGKFD